MQSTRDFTWIRAFVGLLASSLSACSAPLPEQSGGDPVVEDPTEDTGTTGGARDTGTGATVDTGSTGGGSDTGGTSGGSDTGGGGPEVPYPSGPYGFAEGNTLGNFTFMGYRDGKGAWTTLKISDYYDPTGSRGIRAFYVTLGKVLCGACVQEAPKINEWKAKYAPHGATFLSVLHSGSVRLPDGSFTATQSSADAWIAEFSITYDTGIDPKYQLNGGKEPSTDPVGWLVDPRTMKIVKRYGGAPGFLMGMDTLLKKNGATGL